MFVFSSASFSNSLWVGREGRADYLWGQHRIKEKQGSSGDFAKNDHNNDVADNDDVENYIL